MPFTSFKSVEIVLLSIIAQFKIYCYRGFSGFVSNTKLRKIGSNQRRYKGFIHLGKSVRLNKCFMPCITKTYI